MKQTNIEILKDVGIGIQITKPFLLFDKYETSKGVIYNHTVAFKVKVRTNSHINEKEFFISITKKTHDKLKKKGMKVIK